MSSDLPEKMNRAELMSLVTGMRGKLREQWRDPQAQQDAGSNRTETEVKDEVSRGYRTALELVKRGLKSEEAEWKEFIVRGQLFFDASEYEFARQIKLTDYVSLRDEAFGSYKKASEIYAAKVPDMAKGQWTMEPYQMWFFVMLARAIFRNSRAPPPAPTPDSSSSATPCARCPARRWKGTSKNSARCWAECSARCRRT